MAKNQEAQAKKKSRVKKTAKRVGAAAATVYGTRVYIAGSKAKRKAQYSAVRGDMRRAGTAARKTAKKVGNSRPAVGAAMYGERAAGHVRSKAGSAAKGFKSYAYPAGVGFHAGKAGVRMSTAKGSPRKRVAAGNAAGRAVGHVGSHKKAYAGGAAAVGVAGAAAAYRRRKKKKQELKKNGAYQAPKTRGGRR